jgi:hypothetical protein
VYVLWISEEKPITSVIQRWENPAAIVDFLRRHGARELIFQRVTNYSSEWLYEKPGKP